jgi:hypothetical protein
MSDDQQIQQQYPYSVKIEQTALGARVSVHYYGYTMGDTVQESVKLYGHTRDELMAAGFKIAPEEPRSKMGDKIHTYE